MANNNTIILRSLQHKMNNSSLLLLSEEDHLQNKLTMKKRMIKSKNALNKIIKGTLAKITKCLSKLLQRQSLCFIKQHKILTDSQVQRRSSNHLNLIYNKILEVF
jgi:hypothetical protein